MAKFNLFFISVTVMVSTLQAQAQGTQNRECVSCKYSETGGYAPGKNNSNISITSGGKKVTMGAERMPPPFSSGTTKQAVEDSLGDCIEAYKSSETTCGILTNPALLGAATMFQGMASSMSGSGGSLKERCEKAEMFAQVGTGMNSAFASGCFATANSCDRTCNTKKEESASAAEEFHGRAEQAYGEYIRCFHNEENKGKDGSEANQVCGQAYQEAMEYKDLFEKNKVVAKKAAEFEGNCERMYVQTLPAVVQAAANAAQWAAANSCKKNASDGFDMASFCRDPNNKGHPSCGGVPDCNSATGSQLPQCICADPKVARTNPICKGYKPGGPGGGVFPTAGAGFKASEALAGIDPNGVNGVPSGAGAGDNGLKNDGVQQGGGGGMGGMGQASLNPEEGGGQEPDYKTDVNEGYVRGGRGGSGGDMGFMSGTSGGGGGSGSSYKAPNFDLSRFLPGQKKAAQARMVATQGLKAEGVTPAAGPSIWEKVSTRMKAIRGNLK